MKEGAIKSARIDKSGFTKVDIREISELDLKSRKAKLYTFHPESSYSLERKTPDDKNLVLKITDYKTFWANSKILVIEIK